MEIPTNTNGDIHYAEIIIEKQALEIRELQATICRLKAEYLEQRDRERLERQVDAEARRIRNLP